MPEFEGYTATMPPVPVDWFQQLASVSMLCGAGATALFVAHQAIGTKQTRNVRRDVSLALFASLALGSGLLFGLLASGIWF
jgi:ABC-type Mn2+/Zn2+ transport system permease subunit